MVNAVSSEFMRQVTANKKSDTLHIFITCFFSASDVTIFLMFVSVCDNIMGFIIAGTLVVI